jgi:hypothetical protein
LLSQGKTALVESATAIKAIDKLSTLSNLEEIELGSLIFESNFETLAD